MTGKSFTKIRKMVYEKIFRKPFSKTFHASSLPLYSLSLLSLSRPTSLCSPRATPPVLRLPRRNPPPLSSFSHRPPHPLGLVIGLVQEQIWDPLGLAVVTTGMVLRGWWWVVGHWALRWSQADLVTGLRWSLSHLTVSLGFAMDSSLDVLLRQEPMLLMIVMICGFWFVCFGLFLVLIEWVLLWWWVCGFFIMVVCVDLWWITVVGLQFAVGFWFFSFFHFTLLQTLENIFQTIFWNAIKHKKKLFFLKSFIFANILRWKFGAKCLQIDSTFVCLQIYLNYIFAIIYSLSIFANIIYICKHNIYKEVSILIMKI